MSRNYMEHPERFPWVEKMAREIEMDTNPSFQRFYAGRMAEQEACTCETDGGYGDDGSQCRRTPKRGCPTHAEEDEDNDAFDDLIDDAMSTVETRPLDQTFNDCTSGERPRK